MEQEGTIPEEFLLRLQEISEHADEVGFLAQELLSKSPPAALSVGTNDVTTLLTLLMLSFFLGSFTILGKASGKANLLIVNLTAPVCTAIATGMWLVVSDAASMGQTHRLLLVFLLTFGVSGGLAAVYRRFDIEFFRKKTKPPPSPRKKNPEQI